MRFLATISLGVAIALASTGSSVSQTLDNPGVQRCDAGLQRSISACNNMHEVGNSGWKKCLDYSIATHRACVMEAVAHMDTLEPA